MDKIEKKIGLIIGKFLPLHSGHTYFINKILDEVDKLVVLVDEDKITHLKICEDANIKYPNLEVRTSWLKSLFGKNNKIEILSMDEDGIKPYPYGWSEWSRKVQSVVGDKITHIFTSDIEYKEGYKTFFSKYTSVFLDNDRKATNGISSTIIRSDLKKYNDKMPVAVRNFFKSN